MTNYSTGHYAEQVAAEYLQDKGYEIIAMNWRHKRAEIDIVARKPAPRWRRQNPVVFFEVKHRKTSLQGSGLDYITSAKLQQMQFAARLWIGANGYNGPMQLGAIELHGSGYQVTKFVENIVL